MDNVLIVSTPEQSLPAPRALPAPETGVSPQHHYWPLPPAGKIYWWTYLWADGFNYRCTGPLPAGKMALVAQNLHDGAFRSNQPGVEQLISISFFKSIDCSYWSPNRGEILRWYCRGYRGWHNGSTLIANILSFRGHSRWCMDRSGNTILKRGTLNADFINGRYTGESATDPNLNVTYPAPPLVLGTRYGDVFFNSEPAYANTLPPYPVVPDRPLNLDVTVSTFYRNIGTGRQGWWDTRQCDPSGRPCVGVDSGTTWFVSWKEVPGYTYQGKKVHYAGFCEPGLQSTTVGPTEEWWFAEDIGPIYVIAYPFSTLAQSKALLYGTSVYPNPSLDQSPETHIQRRLNTMIGFHTLTGFSIDGTGSVQY
jgi:hypothetical protein